VLPVATNAYHGRVQERQSLDGFLAEARDQAANGARVEISIRELVHFAGAWRRGVRVMEEIQAALDRHELVTEPSFTSGWIDTVVELRPKKGPSPGADDAQSPQERTSQSAEPEVSLTVGALESASAGVESIQRNSDLAVARAMMMHHNYSQLAVLSGARDLVGAVSWESIGQTAMTRPDCTLQEATKRARVVQLDDDLIDLIPTIVEDGFVFVAAVDRKLGGIVTMADLSERFGAVAEPFLLIGEIERRLRQIISLRFDLDELASVRDPSDASRTITSVHDLALGEIVRFLGQQEHWDMLHWPLDRSEFIKALDEVREIRNEVMHFSPDPHSEQEQAILRNFANWLRVMEPRQ
jgi:hypothetical protein